MTDTVREQFERCALKIEDLHQELKAAVEAGNFGLARTIAAPIKEAETIRDNLLCCLGAALKVSPMRPVPDRNRLTLVH
jgi:hypothetical protein